MCIVVISVIIGNESFDMLGMCGLIGFFLIFCEIYRLIYNIRNIGVNINVVCVCLIIRIVNFCFNKEIMFC